jgi:hypothetical protein
MKILWRQYMKFGFHCTGFSRHSQRLECFCAEFYQILKKKYRKYVPRFIHALKWSAVLSTLSFTTLLITKYNYVE